MLTWGFKCHIFVNILFERVRYFFFSHMSYIFYSAHFRNLNVFVPITATIPYVADYRAAPERVRRCLCSSFGGNSFKSTNYTQTAISGGFKQQSKKAVGEYICTSLSFFIRCRHAAKSLVDNTMLVMTGGVWAFIKKEKYKWQLQ